MSMGDYGRALLRERNDAPRDWCTEHCTERFNCQFEHDAEAQAYADERSN